MSTFTVNVGCAVAPNVSVDLYSAWGQSTSNYDYDVYYYIDSGSPVYWGTVTGSICGNLDTASVPVGSTLNVYAVENTNNNQVKIRGANSGTCPGNLAVTCVYSVVINATGSVAITIYVDGNGNPEFCT